LAGNDYRQVKLITFIQPFHLVVLVLYVQLILQTLANITMRYIGRANTSRFLLPQKAAPHWRAAELCVEVVEKP